jgi:hypothetical protein
MAFTIECPHCHRTLNVTEKAFGRTLPCPGCNQPIKVPQPAQPSPTLPVDAPPRNLRPAVSDALPQSDKTFTVLTQIAGAVACMIGVILGLWVYAHRPGSVEQSFQFEGWVLKPLPYYLAMAFSVFVLVSGVVGALRPESLAGRILVWIVVTFGVILLSLAIVVLVAQLRPKEAAPEIRAQAMAKEAAPKRRPNVSQPTESKPPGEPGNGTRKSGLVTLSPVIGPTDGGETAPGSPPVKPSKKETLEAKLLRHKSTINTSTAIYAAVANKDVRIIEVADTCMADQFDAEQTRLLRDWVSNGGVLWVNSNVLSLFGVRRGQINNSGEKECVSAGGSHTILEGCKGVVVTLPYGTAKSHTLAYRNVIPLLSLRRDIGFTPAGTTLWSLVPYGKGWISDPKLVDLEREDGALFWGRFCQFCLHELPWPPPVVDSGGKPLEGPSGQDSLAGTWQASTGAQFRIDDDGKALTISLITSDALREFTGKLIRRDEKPESKSLTGTLDVVFRVDAPRKYAIRVTATFDDQNHLRLRCSDWPVWNNNGRNIGKKVLNESWNRSDGTSAGP